ncbi:hypothetical protein RK21_05705 [Pseudomonas plecoglossicida]|nr:hypothetical protein RK21_05705 [Pseudomonas plecoglossicida]
MILWERACPRRKATRSLISTRSSMMLDHRLFMPPDKAGIIPRLLHSSAFSQIAGRPFDPGPCLPCIAPSLGLPGVVAHRQCP